MKSKNRHELRNMFKWSINTLFNNDSEERMNLFDLNKIVKEAWNELIEEGKVIIYNDKEEDERKEII